MVAETLAAGEGHAWSLEDARVRSGRRGWRSGAMGSRGCAGRRRIPSELAEIGRRRCSREGEGETSGRERGERERRWGPCGERGDRERRWGSTIFFVPAKKEIAPPLCRPPAHGKDSLPSAGRRQIIG